MYKGFIDYNFTTNTVDYSLTYSSSSLNLGHLMTRATASNGDPYVTPVETRFIRGYEIGNNTVFQINNLGFLKYNDNISWIFYVNGNDSGTSVAKRIFLSTYNKSLNQFQEVGSINVNYPPNNNHRCLSLNPSMEYHTTGTVSVLGASVSGVGTNWQTDGVCVGNRIGFGSTNSIDINFWYQISSVDSDTQLTISREFSTDGDLSTLSFTAGTPYVIEDFRLIYGNISSSTVYRGIALVKGLRYENFTNSPTTIPAATTVDNIRACYRILDSSTSTAVFAPVGIILEDKVSFTEQYIYTLTPNTTTTISIQKFNIRASLTLTSGYSNSPYVFTTGIVAHGGSNMIYSNPFIKAKDDDYFVNLYTRISRIIPANIASASTNFIGDEMPEITAGSSTTFQVSSQLQGFHYLPLIDRFYISHEQGTIKNYITPYTIVGNQFERAFNINDTIQSNSYVVSLVDTLTTNFISLPLRSYYHDGLSYILRDTNTDNNLVYTLPLEADKRYHTASNACVITPEITTSNNYSYDKVYLRTDLSFNSGRLMKPTENVDVYFRTSGISNDTGTWSLIGENGDISYATGSSIQFKITFSTIGLNSIPDKVYGLALTYFSQDIPPSLNYFEPSLKLSNLTTENFVWRQVQVFPDLVPNISIDIYGVTSSLLLLTDDTDNSTNGTWEYSTNNGLSWSAFTNSANSIDNYLRYTPNSSLGTGISVKPILYESASQSYVSPIPSPEPEELDFDTETFIGVVGITNSTITTAINDMVVDLKSNNLWSKMTALYPFVGGDATSHKYNLKDPTLYELNFIGGWTHDSLGILMNGTNTYASTTILVSNGNRSISAYLTQRINGNQGAIMGAANVGYFGLRATETEDLFHNHSGTTPKTITPAVIHPYVGNSRVGATEWYAQNDNDVFTTFTDTITNGAEVMIGRFANTTWYGAHQLGFAHIGDPLTQAEMSILRTIVINFQTTLGRNV